MKSVDRRGGLQKPQKARAVVGQVACRKVAWRNVEDAAVSVDPEAHSVPGVV